MILSSLIPPPSCIICGKTKDRICPECKRFLKAHEDICPLCHHYSPNGKVCPDCQIKYSPYFEGVSIVFKATPPIRKLLIKLKYKHQKDISRFFAKFLLLEIQRNPFLKNKNLGITFVPSHRVKTIFKRWYSQSYRLAYHLANTMWQKPIKVCEKAKNTVSQLTLNKYQREKNVLGAFRPVQAVSLKKLDYLILIDDILTTGATLQEVSKCIKNTYPYLKIWGVVVWRYA